MMPYSMPLWTILTKCPPPLGPQWRYPRSAVPPMASRPGVRGISPAPGQSCAKSGSTGLTTARAALAKGRVRPLDPPRAAADQQTVPALPTQDPPARPDIHVLDTLRLEL